MKQLLKKYFFIKSAVAELLSRLQPTHRHNNNILLLLCQIPYHRYFDYLLNKSLRAFLFTSRFILAM